MALEWRHMAQIALSPVIPLRPSPRPRPRLLPAKHVDGLVDLGPLELRQRVRSGVEYALLEALMELFELDREELSRALNIPSRTLARRRSEKKLPADESDRVARLARIAAQATDTLGSPAKASRWLKAPNRALGGEAPLELLDTDGGCRQVEAILGRIEHGVFS